MHLNLNMCLAGEMTYKKSTLLPLSVHRYIIMYQLRRRYDAAAVIYMHRARCAMRARAPCMQASMPACMHLPASMRRCLHAGTYLHACMQASTSCLQLLLLLLVKDFVTDSAVVYFFACIYGSCLYITT